MQETYARVLARPRLLRNDDDLGYLLRVLRNTFISKLRATARRPRVATDPEVVDLPDVRATARAAGRGRSARGLRRGRPCPDFRPRARGRHVAGLSYSEAAKALRVRRGTITSRLFRARSRVAESLTGPRRDQRRTPKPLDSKVGVPA